MGNQVSSWVTDTTCTSRCNDDATCFAASLKSYDGGTYLCTVFLGQQRTGACGQSDPGATCFSKSCVVTTVTTTCPQQHFHKLGDGCCAGEKLVKLYEGSATFDECQDSCDKNPDCVAFGHRSLGSGAWDTCMMYNGS